MGYFFPHNKDGSGHDGPIGCQTSDAVVDTGGIVNENSDGSVSVYNNDGSYRPLTKECCETLNPSYTFDFNEQQCRWGAGCDEDNKPYQLVLNPNGNAGVIFDVDGDNGEDCILNVKFDYLFNLDCDIIYDALQANQLFTLDGDTQALVFQLSGRCEEISTLVSTLEVNLISLTTELSNTPYVIQCSEIIKDPEHEVHETQKTVGGFNSLLPPNAFPISEYGIVTYCLTPSGLTAWNTILGTVNYDTWFASEGVNTSLYTCVDVDALLDLDNGSGDLIGTCDVSVTTRQEIITQITETQEEIITLTNECDEIQIQIATLIGDTNCNTFLEMLETLNVSMTLEVIDYPSPANTPVSTTVYEETIFNIGEDNLLDYLLSANGKTGFYISGSETNNICEVIEGGLVDDINATGDLTGIFETNSELVDLVNTSFNSEWLGADINITDPAIISGITNQEIKISLKINDCCFDLGILIDRIEMNKECSNTESTTIRINKCPSFDLVRVCDNKKSWLTNEDAEKREFDLKLRGTGYNIKDYRLAINSKEVDLDINPANAIEQDLYCYVKDNPCLLDCTTGTTSVTASTDYDFGAILSAQTLACEPDFQSGCTVDTIWGIDVSLGCETIYSNDSFYVSTGITDTPTQQEYLIELSGIAATLGLEFTSGATEVIFTDVVDCEGVNYLNETFKVDLTLDITTLCIKNFQDGEDFLFQDDTPYEFN